MKGTTKVWTGVLAAGLLAGCASEPPKSRAEIEAAARGESVPGTALLFVETEAGTTQPFTSRMFVNRNFIHMSDSRSPRDYILFDRRKQIIYSVNADDRTVFEIHPKAIEIDPPIAIDYQETSQPSSAIPKIDGRQATHYRYTANGKRCYDAVVTPKDFLPEVRKALVEFRTVLAGEHASTLGNMPRDMLDPCDLAVNIFEASRHYSHGLPIREWGNGGYQRFLKDYKTDFTVPLEILALPEGYRHYSVGSVLPEDAADGAGD